MDPYRFILAAPPPSFFYVGRLYFWWLSLKPWLRWVSAMTLIALLIGIPLSVIIVRGWAGLFLFGKIILLTIVVCLIPTIASSVIKPKGRIALVFLEILFFTIVMIVFSLWLFGISSIGAWVIYAFLVIVLLEVGAHTIEWQKNYYMERLMQSSLSSRLQENIVSFEKMFHNELTLYISVPVGLVGGTLFGLYSGSTPTSIITLCLLVIFILSSLTLAFFLIVTFFKMSNPLFKESDIVSPTISQEDSSSGKIASVLNLILPKQKPKDQEAQLKELDLVIEISYFRKLYLYDAVHNFALTSILLFFILRLLGVVLDKVYVVVFFLAGSLIINQLPYLIGQSSLRKNFLKRYTGVKHLEMNEKLDKYAPLIPKFEFFASLTASGTAGGIFYYLIDQFAKNAFK